MFLQRILWIFSNVELYLFKLQNIFVEIILKIYKNKKNKNIWKHKSRRQMERREEGGEHVLAALYFGQKLPPLICLSQWMREEIEGNLVCLQTFQAFNVFFKWFAFFYFSFLYLCLYIADMEVIWNLCTGEILFWPGNYLKLYNKHLVYLFKLQNVFVQISKCIRSICKMYLFKVLNIFVVWGKERYGCLA